MTKPDPSCLLRLDLFTNVSSEGIGTIRALGRMDSLGKDEFVFEQEATAERAYVLVEGSIRIVQTGYDGGQAIIRFIAPGDMFGTVDRKSVV